MLLVNARHVKNVPGRKSDALDAVWLAQLTECGLLRGSFIPPPAIAAIRELTRYRKKLIEQRTSELQRLARSSRTVGIKIDSVASTLTTLSGPGHDRGADRRGTRPRGAGGPGSRR